MPFKYILFNKPFGVLSQFTDSQARPTLKDFVHIPCVYPCGRLDFDSEGLLVLSDDGDFQQKLSQPAFGLKKTYIAQVEGTALAAQTRALEKGVSIGGSSTMPASAKILGELPFELWDRPKQVRFRKNIPTSWIQLSITEGRNRQVRRMTAAVGLPCLRLIRVSVGPFHLDGLLPGEYRTADRVDVERIINAS